jgi:hypothetical protein
MPLLHWADAMERSDDPQDDDVAAAIAAVEHEAAVLNSTRRAIDTAAGCFVNGHVELVRTLVERLEERLFAQPRLCCAHEDSIRLWTLWSGPFLAMVCADPECLGALAEHIRSTDHIPFCALCDDRSPWRRLVELTIAVNPGEARVLVHADHID